MNRWYHLINNFGVETNLGTPASEGSDILTSTYYGKDQGLTTITTYTDLLHVHKNDSIYNGLS